VTLQAPPLTLFLAAEQSWSTARQPLAHYTWQHVTRWHTAKRHEHVQLMVRAIFRTNLA
jgi:hypothetical protein